MVCKRRRSTIQIIGLFRNPSLALRSYWSRDGEKGDLFDGLSNIRIDGGVAHFELGQIPEHAVELKAAAKFLVANYGRQKIISMPRSVPKIAIFEEAARTLDISGGTKRIQEYCRQMRKFGCNILAVVQQYDIIKDSARERCDDW
jgi:hypothetical protein